MTDGIWPEKLTAKKISSPFDVVSIQAKKLQSLTSNIIVATVSKSSGIENAMYGIVADFHWNFDLSSPKLNDFKYPLFSFSYPVTMYPTIFRLKKEIIGDISYSVPKDALMKSKLILVKNEAQLMNTLKSIFRSPTVVEVLESMLALASKPG